MPVPFEFTLSGFEVGQNTVADPYELGEAAVYAENVDLDARTIQGFFKPGNPTRILTVVDNSRLLHYAADDDWLTSTGRDWALDDAAESGEGDRITYYTDRFTGTGIPRVLIGDTSYRLGLVAPGGTPAVADGSGTGGARSYAVTFYCEDTGLESNPLTLGDTTDLDGAHISGIPTFDAEDADDPNRTSVIRRLYATNADDPNGPKYRLLVTADGTDPLDNNTATTFTDDPATYSVNESLPLNWTFGGSVLSNEEYPYDHAPAPALTIMANALHSVNGGQGAPGSGILVGALDNWLVWSRIGYPAYWPAANWMRLESKIGAIVAMDTESFVFTESAIFSFNGFTDERMTLTRTRALHGLLERHGKTVAKTEYGIVYLTTQGLCLFDGIQSTVLSGPFWSPAEARLIASGDAAGFYYEGIYRLWVDGVGSYLFDMRAWPKIRFSTHTLGDFYAGSVVNRIPVGSIWLISPYPGLYIVDSEGAVRPWIVSAGERLGERASWKWQTGLLRPGSSTFLQEFRQIWVHCKGKVKASFYLDHIDRTKRPFFTFTFSERLPRTKLPATMRSRGVSILFEGDGTTELYSFTLRGDTLNGP